LWDGNELPARSTFNPAKVKSFLPSLLMFDVVLDRSVTVRLAGTGFAIVLGSELTGKDWLALAPDSHRTTRLHLFSTVARGAVLMAHRRLRLLTGQDFISEEVLLPFAGDGHGTHQVLVHVNWKSGQAQKIASVSQVLGDPIDHKMVSLR
jgi:hypothetical protein